jgi:exo-beta-1,3-glucanase (GH17 family)
MRRYNALLAMLFGGTFLVLWLLAPAAIGGKNASAPAYPITVRPETLASGGVVSTMASYASECARRGLVAPGKGGVVIGIRSCEDRSAPGGWVQVDQVFEDPYGPSVLTIRVVPPEGAGRSIQSSRRDGRARMLLDGRPIWDARASHEDGGGRYFAIIEPDVFTTMVIKGRSLHKLRFETEPGVMWRIGAIEISAHAAPKALRGIAYSPYRDCQTPTSTRQPRLAEVDGDMFRIAHSSNAVRTYSAMGINARVVSAATALGHPVYAGAWLDKVEADESELRALVDLARTSRPAGLIVGNEFYLRHRNAGRAAVDYLLNRIRLVKALLPTQHPPIMTADVDGIMFEWDCEGGNLKVKGITREYEPILNETDAVLVHIYPFWDGRPIGGAAALTAAKYAAIREFVHKRYPGKRVIVGEAGWPSAGLRHGDAVPDPGSQRQYMADFMRFADAMGIDYFYFDAFDEGWKVAEPGHVGQHWGYADSTRAAKYDVFGVLIPGALLPSTVTVPPAERAGVTGKLSSPMCGGTPNVTTGAGTPTDSAGQDNKAHEDEVIYSDWLSDDSKFVPVGWMGDVNKIDLFECDRSSPHGGEMAIRAEFSPDGQKGWAGVVWQEASSEWGTRPGGRDLRRFDRLSFWVKGNKGGEVVEFKVGGIGKAQDNHRDTLRPARSSGPVILSADWQQVTIGLRGADLTRVVGGFSWIADRCQNHQPITFFIDDIRFETTATVATSSQVLARKPFYVYSDDGSACEHYVPSGFMGDAGDLTLNTKSRESAFKGHTAIQVTYHPHSNAANGWAGIYWQEPSKNWGGQDGGFDLSWATVLTFYARGRKGGETLEFIAGGLGKAPDRYRDSLPKVTTGRVQLTKNWQLYSIDLRGQDLSRVAGGFGFALNSDDNPDGAEFFLDEIAYQRRSSEPIPPWPKPGIR